MSGNLAAQPEVMAWGNLTGIRVDGQLISPAAAGNRMYLSGGNWKIQRSSEVVADGEHISRPEFPVDGWVVATVPGTALVSYWNAGASALDEPPVLAVNGMADL